MKNSWMIISICKSKIFKIGSYQFVSGVDCSSSASVAAYLNDIFNNVPKNHKCSRAIYWYVKLI